MKNKNKLQAILVIIGIILQSIGLVVYFYKKSSLSFALMVGAIILIISSFFVLSKEEKEIEDIEINDERNTMIRNMAHAKTNTIMIFIQTILAIVLVFLNYYTLAILLASLVVFNGIIICIIRSKIEKEY